MNGAILGQFELVRRLGTGGMGQVWLARHIAQGRDVAIKFLTAEATLTAEFHRAFEQEVLSMARLQHPHIALLIDYGVLGAPLGQLPAESPFLVMEYVAGVSLRERGALSGWRELFALCTDLLEALAHAHARGIIHRDLKPHNVLFTRQGRAKLLDFGIARDLEQAQERRDITDSADTSSSYMRITGTPRYMSPEQIDGHWRDHGPWTDLYALGCLLWEVTTGEPLFEGNLVAVLSSQMTEEPGEFHPSFPLPQGFEAWLRVLLRKSPRERFQRAADALAALQAIDPNHQRPASPAHRALDAEASPEEETLLVELDVGLTDTIERLRRAQEEPHAPLQRHETPAAATIPTSWRGDEAPRRFDLLGCGLGLWGVRAMPMIGRERERDLLWQHLVLAATYRSPQLVALRGQPGCGKSHLAHWLCTRAHELGAAHILRITHSPDMGPSMAWARCWPASSACTAWSAPRAPRASSPGSARRAAWTWPHWWRSSSRIGSMRAAAPLTISTRNFITCARNTTPSSTSSCGSPRSAP